MLKTYTPMPKTPYAENALVIFEHSFRQCQKRIPLCRKRIHHMLKTHRSLDSWCHKQALDLGKKTVERLQFSHTLHNPRSPEKWFSICPNSFQRLTHQLMFSTLTALYGLLFPLAPRLWRHQFLDLLGGTYSEGWSREGFGVSQSTLHYHYKS